MPYIYRVQRAGLYPYINMLVGEMLSVDTEARLKALTPHVEMLANAINIVAGKHNFGAFAEELNFVLHTILLRMSLAMEYSRSAHFTGWLEEVIGLFRGLRLEQIRGAYNKKRNSLSTARSEFRFAYVTAWVFIETCLHVAPDHSDETCHLIVGVLKHIDMEFYRRSVARYQDRRIVNPEHGDLPEYRILNEDIEKK